MHQLWAKVPSLVATAQLDVGTLSAYRIQISCCDRSASTLLLFESLFRGSPFGRSVPPRLDHR